MLGYFYKMQIKYDNQDKEWEECTIDEEKINHSKKWLKKIHLITGDIKECFLN